MSIKVMSVFGTRPEAIKMLPLVHAITKDPRFQNLVCVTAQHREMLDQVLDTFQVKPHYDLDLMTPRQTLTDITGNVLRGMEGVFAEAKPDIVLVHGDTTTSFAAALAAFYQQIPVGHVEAGLRTYDRYSPFPEEMNRNLTSKLATLHFAPTQLNVENLARESITDHVYITGNTVIDALLSIVRPDYVFHESALDHLSYEGMRTVLMTAHRRENLGQPMRNIFEAVLKLVQRHPDVQVIYPMHKNPAVRQPAFEILGHHPRIHLIEPIGVSDMHNLFTKCYFIMTDSGGLQEEAPALGKPVLVLRTETERPEAVAAGTAKVVGIEREDILREAERLLEDPIEYKRMSQAQNPYGDGHASRRICDAIADFFNSPSRREHC
ncbi:MAG: UDP-N-acetylglucosamine 2-epimerase (non-hydrolyzing) [Clostridiales bacterium]|nr:UDP-N-acetylglucosamine 2-epimerase (non-hydrolyzing) [Clostridiales bacterium]